MTTVHDPKVSPPSGKSEDLKEKGFFNRPRLGGKSIWDWMQLLIIPIILVTVGYLFSNQQAQTSLQVSQQQHDTDQRQALDQQRATILQTYIDNIQDLLLNHNLLKSKPGDDGAILARARTLTALQGLDPVRKGLLVKFIYEARLIGFGTADIKLIKFNFYDSIINLRDADLSGADLSGANLFGATLSSVNLHDANLHDAFLFHVNFSYADLSGANLFGATLSSVNFSHANLSGTNLRGADLANADLALADNLTQQQLDQVDSCKGADLIGLTCHQNY